jgi:uncharacterized protein
MKIAVRIKPNAKENRVEETGLHQFLVRVKAPPKENKANREMIGTLAAYFRVPKSKVSILSGLKSKQKVVEIAVETEEKG